MYMSELLAAFFFFPYHHDDNKADDASSGVDGGTPTEVSTNHQQSMNTHP